MRQHTHDRLVTAFALLGGIAISAILSLGYGFLIPFTGEGFLAKRIILLFILTGIAAGSYAGSLLSEYKRSDKVLLLVLFFSGVILMLLPFYSSKVYGLTGPLTTFRAMVFACIPVLWVPSILISSTIPLTISALKGGTAGLHARKTGIVFSVVITGAAIGSIAFPFYLIPLFGINGSAVFTGFLLSIYPAIQLFRLGWKNPGIVGMLISLILSSSYYLYGSNQIRMELDIRKLGPQYQESKDPNGNKQILLNGLWFAQETPIYNPKENMIFNNFIHGIMDTYFPGSNILLFGISDKMIPHEAKKNRFKLNVVEEEPFLIRKFLAEYDTSSGIKSTPDDPRKFINDCNDYYDMIFFDVFRGDEIPDHLFTAESFAKIRTRIKPDGIAVINVPGKISQDNEGFIRSLYKTIRSLGLFTEVLDVQYSSNTLILFSGSRDAFENHLQAETKKFYYPLDSIKVNDAQILTDNRPLISLKGLSIMMHQRKERFETGRDLAR